MKIQSADKNDRKAVWFWIQDPMNRFFINNKNIPDYSQHCVWFDAMCKKENIIIGLKDNLRIGLGILLKEQNTLIAKFYLKPVYCGVIGVEFVSGACEFLYQKKGEPIHVDCLSNEKIKQDLLESGFSKTDEKFLQYSRK